MEVNFEKEFEKLFHPKFNGNYKEVIKKNDYKLVISSLNAMRDSGNYLIYNIELSKEYNHYIVDYLLENENDKNKAIQKYLVITTSL